MGKNLFLYINCVAHSYQLCQLFVFYAFSSTAALFYLHLFIVRRFYFTLSCYDFIGIVLLTICLKKCLNDGFDPVFKLS